MAKAIALSLEQADATSGQHVFRYENESGSYEMNINPKEEEKPKGAEKEEEEEEMVPVPVNEGHLQQLLGMGFSDIMCRKGLVHGKTVDGAVDWISQHQSDPDIDQPYLVRKRDTLPKKELTPEERKEKEAAVKALIERRRVEKAKAEKEEEVRREKERRERGQKLEQTTEERDRLARKREAERLKKEKNDIARERERLRAEIERDKAIRKANKGVLPSVLGVDGYNPSIISYNTEDKSVAPAAVPKAEAKAAVTPAVAAAKAAAPAAAPKAAAAFPSAAAKEDCGDAATQIDKAIATISKYRTGGDGGEALKLMVTFVKNIVDNPSEQKYRSINMESNAYKNRLQCIVGPAVVFKALGFVKSEDGKLVLADSSPLLAATLAKLVEAERRYRDAV